MNDDDLRDLFGRAREAAGPPAGARERVLAKLGAPPPAMPSNPPPAPAAVTPLTVKLIVGACVVGGALVVAALVVRAPRAAAPTSAITASVIAPALSALPAPSEAAEPAPAPAIESAAPTEPLPVPLKSAAAGPAPSASDAKSTLAEETALLREAEAALRGGNPSKALSLLADHARRFPRGVLGQERTVTQIRALCASGRTAQAKSLYQRLRAGAPKSPHLASLERSCPALASE